MISVSRSHATGKDAPRRRPQRLLSLTWVVALVALLLPATASANVPFKEITSTGPIETIWLGDELSCQVLLEGDEDFAFFPSSTAPGDCGTFLTLGTDEFGPNFDEHDSSAFGPGTGTTSYTPFTPVSQTDVSGTGTSADPFVVVTVVDVPAPDSLAEKGGNGLLPGLRITQTDSYVTGNQFYESEINVANMGASPQDAVLYHAGDCFLAGSDSGFGHEIPATGSIFCSETPSNDPPGRLIGFQPQSAGSSYIEDNFSTVWDEIDGGVFGNTCAHCDPAGEEDDNGMGLSWAISVPSGGEVTRTMITSIDPTGDVDPPETTITSGPGEGSTISDDTPTYEFISDEAGSTFECSVDGGPFEPCDSPETIGPLADGPHTFAVRAIDTSGNVDPTPAERSFTVDTEGPPPPPPPEGTCQGKAVTISGTEGPDAITGTPGADVIDAKGGDDQISGLGGDDVICAGDGDDVVSGGAGNDSISGQAGNDEIGGGGNVDRIAGGSGDDTISGGLDHDRIGGGAGNDEIGGGPGNDRIGGGADDDSISGGIGADSVTGGAGNDDIGGGAGNDDIGGGAGNDDIGGGAGNDRVAGGAGDDTLRGAEGDDRIGGGPGADDIAGGGGDDQLFGGIGPDLLVGGPGNDFIMGGPGDDDIDGGTETDHCTGGAGTNNVENCESG